MTEAKKLAYDTAQSPGSTGRPSRLAGTDARAALDPGGLLDGLKKALAERASNAEMDHHLGGADAAENRRNGYSAKAVLTDSGLPAAAISF